MKKSIVAALVLVACLLLAPFGFGKLAEKRVNAGLDELVEQIPYLVIKERNWQGGWFKSRQEVRFEMSPAFAIMFNPAAMQQAIEQSIEQSMAAGAAAAGAEDAEAAAQAPAAVEQPTDSAGEAAAGAEPGAEAPPPAVADAAMPGFTIHNDVVHGPVLGSAGFGLARVDTTFVLPEEILAEVRKYFGPEPALQVRSRVGFFSGGSTTVTSEGRTISAEVGDDELTYETARLVLGYAGNFDSYDAKGELPRVEFKSGEEASVVLTGMTFSADGKRVFGELYDGDFALELGELKATTGGEEYSVADLHYITGVKTSDGFTDISARFGSGAVKAAPITAYGLDVREIHYDMSFRHLHSETVEKMLVAMRDAYTKLPSDSDPAAMMAAMQTGFLGPLMEHAGELLKHDPELGFDRIGVVTADGEGVIKGVVKLIGATPEDFSLAGAMGLLAKVEADFTVEIAQALVDKIPNAGMVVGMAVDQGFATREGDKLVSHIEFKRGALTVNGKALPLPPGIVPVPPPAVAPVPEGV